MRPSGSKETALIPTPRGFGPPYPAWRGKPKHTSLGWLELKSPFACLERDNLSDTSCCMLCPLGHTCYCVTACLKNVGCRGKENDCNLACSNNLRAFFSPRVRKRQEGKGGWGKEKEREKKEKKREKPGWQCWGSAFVTTQRDLRPDGSGPPPPPLARSLAASPLSLKELLRRISRVGF